MSVYLLHLERPLAGRARHYVGYAEHVEQRLKHHRQGTGARMLAVCNERGIAYHLARVWEGAGKAFERRLKQTHNTARYCPLCCNEPREYKPRE